MSSKRKKTTAGKMPTAASYPTISRFFGPTTTTTKKRLRSNDETEEMTDQVVVVEQDVKSPRKISSLDRRETSQDAENVVVILDDEDSSIEQDNGVKDDNVSPPAVPLMDPSLAHDDCPVPVLQQHVDNENEVDEEEVEVTETLEQEIEGTVEEQASASSAKNPFSQFAFSAAGGVASPQKQGSLTKWMKNVTTTIATTTTTNKKKKPRTFQSGGTEWIKMEDLPKQERDKIIAKWHGLADPNASLEDRRFQVLVAARLHARCQEPVVRSAMINLRHALDNDLSVTSVAKANPQDLAPTINNLQYFNTKALQIVKAAQEIKSQFAGVVPESEHLLKQLTGVGPVIADLLAYVNTRARHAKVTTTQATASGNTTATATAAPNRTTE